MIRHKSVAGFASRRGETRLREGSYAGQRPRPSPRKAAQISAQMVEDEEYQLSFERCAGIRELVTATLVGGGELSQYGA